MSLDDLRWGADGLLPVVIQDARSGVVLTLAHANRAALDRTLAEHSTYLYSRRRGELWHKGATSGNTQAVVDVSYDCDADALLYRVIPKGPACHTGAATCFHRRLTAERSVSAIDSAAPGYDGTFERAVGYLKSVIAARRTASPQTSYVAALLHGGVDRIGKKIGEEATEVVIAAKNGTPAEIAWEVADLFFHTLVLLEERGVTLDDVGAELLRRAK